MLDGEAIGGDVVRGDDGTGAGGVGGPAHRVAVVRAPGPDIVDDRVGGVVEQADRRSDGRGLGATDTEEDILDKVRVTGGAEAGPARPDPEKDRPCYPAGA